jgi:predicted metal-binding membrane protein
MNVLWVAVLAVLVLVEKVLPEAWFIPRDLGLVFFAVGLIFLYRTTV